MHTLFWIAVIASVGCVVVALTDLEQWKEFKKTYKKNYTDPAVDAFHFGVFQKSLREVEENHAKYAKDEVTYSIRIIALSDIPKDQWPVLPPLPIGNITRNDDIEEDVRKGLERMEREEAQHHV